MTTSPAKNMADIVLSSCCNNLSALDDEADRIAVCEALFNMILNGDFCDDKRGLIAFQNSKQGHRYMLVDNHDYTEISQFYSGSGKAH